MHPEVQPLLDQPERRSHLPLLVLLLSLALGAMRAGLLGRPLRLLGLAPCGTLLCSLVYYGSLDLWKKQFHAGTVQQRADYDAERWSRSFESYPFLRALFLPDGGR